MYALKLKSNKADTKQDHIQVDINAPHPIGQGGTIIVGCSQAVRQKWFNKTMSQMLCDLGGLTLLVMGVGPSILSFWVQFF